MERKTPSSRIVKAEPKRLYAAVLKGLVKFNRQQTGLPGRKPLALELKGPKGEFLGGLSAQTYWGWLYIDLLWLDERVRQTGQGSELVRRAEALARKRGCRHAFLNTFSFQAPGFYKKLGYKPFGRLKGFPKGHERIWMVKAL